MSAESRGLVSGVSLAHPGLSLPTCAFAFQGDGMMEHKFYGLRDRGEKDLLDTDWTKK